MSLARHELIPTKPRSEHHFEFTLEVLMFSRIRRATMRNRIDAPQIGAQPNNCDNRLNYTQLTSPNTQICAKSVSREVLFWASTTGQESEFVERTPTPNR